MLKFEHRRRTDAGTARDGYKMPAHPGGGLCARLGLELDVGHIRDEVLDDVLGQIPIGLRADTVELPGHAALMMVEV